MTKSGYPYPPDEFDVAVPGGAPVGVHRAPRSGWSSAWPFLLVAVVCAAVAWGGITLLSGGDDPAEASGDPSASASTSASAPASPSTSPGGEGGEGDEGGESGEPSQSSEASVEELVAAIDPAASYMVFNTGGTVNQLAASSATNLEAVGIPNVEVSTEPAPAGVDTSALSANTVWFGEGREAEGKALAAALGIPESNVAKNDAVSASPQAAWVFMFTAPAN
ncbi:MAG TPA: LytR C-terminal domain-containing protein [Promicromonospora sp.]|nr:LytR C-terminal domain-containing protein [Promicromonospora sp.]